MARAPAHVTFTMFVTRLARPETRARVKRPKRGVTLCCSQPRWQPAMPRRKARRFGKSAANGQTAITPALTGAVGLPMTAIRRNGAIVANDVLEIKKTFVGRG